ncbi:cell division cycle-associated protein 3 isoform X1 [Halichoerus grypus]|uniref:cell division cycle-associated protein 3 isoform X1 n=1 Tax=Halichoerus grypus TaxID=9711 RepID=UPI00165A0EA0|nr:cell division cycle-associated protein 3 isoform X1 [Halichoerus grypus]XP_035925227.1 cell division cycle-associated protein 3 isoform X1 [Halichoerus grypus]XP_035925228.1 cell division cycle-associated protein 3 isoform X1 [Halichoerus grypus]
MGSAKSFPVTPARPPPHNKLLARVADPRSPSAGILRTPIQVESSPQPNLPAGEPLEGLNQAQDSDPRSPTLGIARTPMKTSSGEPPSPLVKQLSEVFETEAPKSNLPPEPVLPLEATSSFELDLPLGTQFSLEDQMPPWSQTELPSKQVFSKEEAGQPSETPMASQGSDKPLRDPETPRSSGSKHNRRKANGKVLGRSPLTILQDDNSPGTLTPRQRPSLLQLTHCFWQGKRPSPLSDNARELKEGAVLGTGRLLKTGGRVWEQGQDQDKENQHFPNLVEN